MSWHEFVLRTCLSLHIGKVQRFCALLELCFSTLYNSIILIKLDKKNIDL